MNRKAENPYPKPRHPAREEADATATSYTKEIVTSSCTKEVKE